jgi:hypothetical protein
MQRSVYFSHLVPGEGAEEAASPCLIDCLKLLTFHNAVVWQPTFFGAYGHMKGVGSALLGGYCCNDGGPAELISDVILNNQRRPSAGLL